MSNQEVSKTLLQVAELLLFEEDEKFSFNYEQGNLYESIRHYHIDIAIEKGDIEKAFDLIFTPGKYYNKIHKNNDDIYCKLWKHYGYEFHPGNHNNPATEIPAPPSFTALFLNCILFGDYTPIEATFNEWYIDESLRGKIDKLIDLIKDKIPGAITKKSLNEFINWLDVDNGSLLNFCTHLLTPDDIKLYGWNDSYLPHFWKYIEDIGGFSKCPTCNNIPAVIRSYNRKRNYRISNPLNREGGDEKYFHGPIHSIRCCEHLYFFISKKRYILKNKYKGSNPSKNFVTYEPDIKPFLKSEIELVYVEYNPEDPYDEKAKVEQERKKLAEAEDPRCETKEASTPVQPAPKVIHYGLIKPEKTIRRY